MSLTAVGRNQQANKSHLRFALTARARSAPAQILLDIFARTDTTKLDKIKKINKNKKYRDLCTANIKKVLTMAHSYATIKA
nr:MAG TPA: hypothetical protein [Microviridae sp.]